MKIKRFLILTPLPLFILFAVSLGIVHSRFEQKPNQFVFGSIGDAENLNPILSTDSASGDVTGFVFNGLLKYSENIELVGELAESYVITQVSHIFPKSAPDAHLRKLQTALDSGALAETKIVKTSPAERGAIRLDMNTAGTAYEKRVLNVIPEAALRPINTSVIQLDTRYMFPDGKPCNAREVIGRLTSSLPTALDVLEYYEENSGTIAVKYLADEGKMREALGQFLSAERPQEEEKSPWRNCFGSIIETRASLFDNAPVLTFHLRKDVRWHDGAPFTAADVKFTYDKIMDEQTQTVRRPMFELVKHLETPDDYTVVVTYKKPFSPCLDTWTMSIIPRHLLDGKDINKADFSRNPIGTGPFIFEQWISDDRIFVRANKKYFEGQPQTERVGWRIIPEPPLLRLEFEVGRIDIYGVQPFEYEGLSKDKRYKTYERLGNGYTYIGWNANRDLFKDKRVRRALTHAINREEIVKYVLYGQGVEATGPFPPQMWYSNPSVKPIPYDPAKARELLAEAGWKDTDGDGVLDKDGKKFEFELLTNNGNPLRADVTVLVQRQLAELGIKATPRLMEWAVFIRDRITPRDFDACVLGWSLSYDPDVYEIWHSSQIPKGFNFVGYNNPDVDRLLEEGRLEYDREKRKNIYFKIHELIAEDQPYTFLYVGKGQSTLRPGEFKVRRPNPDGSYTTEDVRMTEAGLMYYLPYWFRVAAAESLAP
ncbi:MAG: peptide-binding protein [Planctomycetota bacterium]